MRKKKTFGNETNLMPPLGIYLSMSLIYERVFFFFQREAFIYVRIINIIFRLLENQFFMFMNVCNLYNMT